MVRPTYIDLKIENKQPFLLPVPEKKETPRPAPVLNRAYTLAILTTLSTADILTTSKVLTSLSTPTTYLPPSPLQILEAAASNPQSGDVTLMILLKDVAKVPCHIITGLPESERAPLLNRALVAAAKNKVLYRECVDVLLKYMGKVRIDGVLVRALAEQPEGKAVLRRVLEVGRGVEFDEWEKGGVVDVVREKFGHVVLGEMVERLGTVSWQSCNDQRYCGAC